MTRVAHAVKTQLGGNPQVDRQRYTLAAVVEPSRSWSQAGHSIYFRVEVRDKGVNDKGERSYSVNFRRLAGSARVFAHLYDGHLFDPYSSQTDTPLFKTKASSSEQKEQATRGAGDAEMKTNEHYREQNMAGRPKLDDTLT